MPGIFLCVPQFDLHYGLSLLWTQHHQKMDRPFDFWKVVSVQSLIQAKPGQKNHTISGTHKSLLRTSYSPWILTRWHLVWHC